MQILCGYISVATEVDHHITLDLWNKDIEEVDEQLTQDPEEECRKAEPDTAKETDGDTIDEEKQRAWREWAHAASRDFSHAFHAVKADALERASSCNLDLKNTGSSRRAMHSAARRGCSRKTMNVLGKTGSSRKVIHARADDPKGTSPTVHITATTGTVDASSQQKRVHFLQHPIIVEDSLPNK